MSSVSVREVDQCSYASYATGKIAAQYVFLRGHDGVDELILLDYEQELSKRGVNVELLTDEGMEGKNFQAWWEAQLAGQGQFH